MTGSPKGAGIDPNLPHATKCYSKVAHAFLYTLMDFFFSRTKQAAVAIYLLPFPNVQLHSSKNDWFPKGAEIDPNLPHANKSVTQGSTRILYIDSFKLCCHSLPSLPFSRTFNCTSK
jgi:hypothetical protein